jgi:hypothetical protein
MKALFGLVILVAVGYVGFQYAYQPLMDMVGLEKQPKVADFTPLEPAVVEASRPAEPKAPKVEEPKPEMPKAPEPAPAPPPAAMPKVVEGMGASVPATDADGFTPPTFPPIEDVVKNWMEIPRSAFQNPIKVMKPVEFVTVINGNKIGSKVPAGGEAHVVGQEGLTLTITPSPTSSAKATIAMDDTNIKEVLTQLYERWKVNMTEYKRRQHLFAKESEGRAKEAKASGKVAAVSNDAPKKNSEGSYDLLLASMKAGQVTEITPTNVKKWGDVQVEKIDGKDYFTVIVDYTTKTMFGDFDTQAQARIAGGKVEKWIYTGSGEVVP